MSWKTAYRSFYYETADEPDDIALDPTTTALLVKDIQNTYPIVVRASDASSTKGTRFEQSGWRNVAISPSITWPSTTNSATIAKWMEDPLMVDSEFLSPGNLHERLHISMRQYARVVYDWVTSVGLEVKA